MHMKLQNFEEINAKIRARFEQLKSNSPERINNRLNLSWSNWGFGLEQLASSAKRLADAGVHYIELHGNHYGPSLGYQADETLKILNDHNM